MTTPKPYNYVRQEHDASKIRYKMTHTTNRLLELSIALRNISEEAKELADFLQEYSFRKSGQVLADERAAKANTATNWVNKGQKTRFPRPHAEVLAEARAKLDPTPAQKAYGKGKANGKAQAELPLTQPEEDPMVKLKKQIVHALMVCSTDYPEDVAPCIPAPPGLVRRIRTQLVEAGKLRPLEDRRNEPPSEPQEAPTS